MVLGKLYKGIGRDGPAAKPVFAAGGDFKTVVVAIAKAVFAVECHLIGERVDVLHLSRPMVTLCFLEKAIDFGALDGQKVNTLFTLISPTGAAVSSA